MMANVSGVSQFLESAGVPGPQAGPESVPGQDFAAVMQKAGNEAGSPIPASTNGLATGQTDEEASGTGTAPSIQTSTQLAQKTPPQAGAGQAAASAPSFRRTYVGGQTQGGGTAVSARPFNTATMPATQAVGTALCSASAPKASPSEAEVTVAGAVSKTPAIPVITAGTPSPAGPQAGSGASQGNEAPVLLAAATTTAVKGNPTAFSSMQPQSANVQKHGGNGAPAVDDAAKPTAGKLDSKLTALIPQGTADVPQSAAGLPAGNPATAIAFTAPAAAPVAGARPPVELAANAVQTPSTSPAVEQLPVLAAGPAPLSSAGTAQGANGKQASSAKGPSIAAFNTPVGPTLASPVVAAPSAPPPSLNPFSSNTAAQQSAAIVTPTAQLPTGKAVSADAQTAPVAASTVGAPSVLNTQVAQAAPQPEVSTIAPASQPNTAFQAALTSNGLPEPTAKPGAHVRSGFTPAKTAGDAATATDPAASKTVAAKMAAPAASASPAPAIAPAQSSPSHAAAMATPNLKVPQKQADAAVSPSAAPLAGSPKSSPSADSTSATATVKDAPSAAAPLAFSPAVAAPAEMAAVVGTATAIPTQAPLVQGTAATNALVVNGVAATNFGAQETGATASGSVPHTTLSATPTSLEVGVSSGTHGWLKIRAELNEAGQVDASLTGANAAAASKLRGDLPALNSYLQGEKVQMGSLDVRSALHTAFESGSTFSQAGSGGGANPSTGTAVSADASAAGGRGQQPQPEANSVPVRDAGRDGDEILPGRISDAAAYGTQTELDGGAGSPSVGYGAGGGWLNVRV